MAKTQIVFGEVGGGIDFNYADVDLNNVVQLAGTGGVTTATVPTTKRAKMVIFSFAHPTTADVAYAGVYINGQATMVGRFNTAIPYACFDGTGNIAVSDNSVTFKSDTVFDVAYGIWY